MAALSLPPVDFSYLQNSLQSDSDLREQIREATRDVEREERRGQAVMNRVHATGRAESESNRLGRCFRATGEGREDDGSSACSPSKRPRMVGLGAEVGPWEDYTVLARSSERLGDCCRALLGLRTSCREGVAVPPTPPGTPCCACLGPSVRSRPRRPTHCSPVAAVTANSFDLTAPALLSTQLDPLLPSLRLTLSSLAALIPASQFYRYSDSFSRSLQAASLTIVLRKFLETEEVATKEEVAEALGSELPVLCEEEEEELME